MSSAWNQAEEPATEAGPAAAQPEPPVARSDGAVDEGSLPGPVAKGTDTSPEPPAARSDGAADDGSLPGPVAKGTDTWDDLDQAIVISPSTPTHERLRVGDPVERYLSDIRRYPILDRESERELTRRFVQTKETKVAVRLITSNLRLVVKIALEYQSPWTDLLDIIQEGNLGLLQAVRKFDPERNIRLSSYAQWWIRAYILKFLMDNHRLVKVGTTQAQRKLFYNLQRERERLERQGFRPTPRLLAKALSVRVKDIVEMETRLATKEVSLEAPLIERDRDRLIDLLPSDQPAVDEMLSKQQITTYLLDRLDEFAATLAGRELEIWIRRLMSEKPVTLQALGNLFGVSRERARQLEARVLKKLKRFLGEERHLIENITFPLFS